MWSLKAEARIKLENNTFPCKACTCKIGWLKRLTILKQNQELMY